MINSDSQHILSCDRHLSEFLMRISSSPDGDLGKLFECLSYSARNGNICLELIADDDADFNKSIENFLESHAVLPLYVSGNLEKKLASLKMLEKKDESSPLVYENNRLYIKRFNEYEKKIAEALLIRSKNPWSFNKRDEVNRIVENIFSDEKDEDQKHSAVLSIDKKLSFITGGPGTGKTTTVVKIIALHLIENQNLRISMAAPTGKAALRLQQSINNAKLYLKKSGTISDEIINKIPSHVETLHRLLGFTGRKYLLNKENPLLSELVIIDEASMVDINMFYRLLQAMREDSGLIILGDHFQLASVEAGSILGDICTSNAADQKKVSALKDNISELKINRRFAGESGIAVLSDVLKNETGENRIRRTLSLLKTNFVGDLNYYQSAGFNEKFNLIIKEYFSTVAGAKNPEEALSLLSKFRILTPHRKGLKGVEMINQYITDYLYRNKILFKSGSYFHGMPVMVLKNDYSLNLFNGDTGILWDAGEGLRAYFDSPESDGSLRSIMPEMISSFEACFAMTVHKSQGSEFDTVLLIMPDASSPVLTVELFYTALTRSKTRFMVSGHDDIITETVSKKIFRASGLRDSLLIDEK